MPEYDLKFKDFTLDDTPIRFKIGPDEFTAPPAVPIPVLRQFAGALTGLEGDGLAALDTVVDLICSILNTESGERFRARIESRDQPVDLNRQLVPLLTWLMEVYGLRPTEPSPLSTNGLSDGGPGSTDGAPNDESSP